MLPKVSGALVALVVALVPVSLTRSSPLASSITWQGPIFGALHSGNLQASALACFGSYGCAAVDRAGTMWESGSLTVNPSPWRPSDVDGATSLVGVACPSRARCVAVDRTGTVVTTSLGPNGPATTATKRADTAGLPTAISCPSAALCVVVDGRGLADVSTNPFAARPTWRVHNIDPGNALSAVSCPTIELCVAVDESGNVVTAADPGSSTAVWHVTAVAAPNALLTVSCATNRLCVAGDDVGDVVVSTTPLRTTRGAWRVAATSEQAAIRSVSCADTQLCVAVLDGDVALATYAPASTVIPWQRVAMAVSSPLVAVSCWASPGCAILDRQGDVLTSTQPVTGSFAVTARLGDPVVTGLSCPSPQMCVAVDTDHGVDASSAPGTATSWSKTLVAGGGSFTSVDCPTTSLCFGVDGQGNVWNSSDPTSGHGAWNSAIVDAAFPLVSVSCIPDGSWCAAVDPVGVLTSGDPTGGASSWVQALLDTQISGLLTSIACPSTSLCVAVTDHGQVVTSYEPGAGASTWTATTIDPGAALRSVACPSTSLCVATDGFGNVLVSQQPGGGASTWTRHTIDLGHALTAVSCPTTSWCAAVDSSGRALASGSPADAGTAWTTSVVPGATSLTALSCASATTCVAGGPHGAVWVGNVTGAPPAAVPVPTPVQRAAASAPAAPRPQFGINSLLLYTCERLSTWDIWAANQVDAFADLGANSVALAFPFYTDGPTSNNFAARTQCGNSSQFATPPPAIVARVVDAAHAAGLKVLLRPYLDQASLAAVNPNDWKGNITPTDPALWFANYRAALDPYLTMAQAHHVEHFAISTELESMANYPYWIATIADAKRRYSGDLVFCASWLDNGDEAPWPGTSEAIDMYRGIPHVGNDATPTELLAGWERVLSTYDALPSISSVTADEVGIPAQDNTYTHPNGSYFPLNQYPFNQAIQANWDTMACDFVKAHHMAGIYFWGSEIYENTGQLLTAPSPSQSINLQPLTQLALHRCFTT